MVIQFISQFDKPFVLQFVKPMVYQIVVQMVIITIKIIKNNHELSPYIKLYYVSETFSTKSEYNRNKAKH